MKYLKLLLALIIFAAGIVIGVVWNDIPGIRLNTEIRILEPVSILLTACIGILIPFFIKRWIDDNRQVKNHLIEQVKDALADVRKIKEKITTCYGQSAITAADKDEIVMRFEECDLKINALQEILAESFATETKEVCTQIKDVYIKYWKLTTSTELMAKSFKKVTPNFYKLHNECFLAFETKMKQSISLLHRI